MLPAVSEAENSVAFVRTYSEDVGDNGNPVVFSQRYAADGSRIGDPIQVTSPAVSGYPASTTLLSDGKFVVAYYVNDPSDPTLPYPYANKLATTEFNPDGSVLTTTDFGLADYPEGRSIQVTALQNGTYAYILEKIAFNFDASTVTHTLGFVDSSGQVRETLINQDYNSPNSGPFPQYHQSEPVLARTSNGTFTISYTGAYSGGDPDFPPSQPTPEGTQTFQKSFDASGRLTKSIFVDFDGTKTTERFDPASGAEIASTVLHGDGSRTDTQFGIEGRPYVEQSISKDATGFVTEVQRYYGDAKHTLAFDLKNAAEGTSEVHHYDTLGREVSRQVGELQGERDATEFSYTGANKTPTTVIAVHFGAGNVQETADTTYANGTHLQESFVAGETLTSHAAVADTFIGVAQGADTFAFHPNFGKDVINNFASGSGANHDILQFDDRLLASVDDLASHLQQVGRDTLIAFDDGSSVLLKNVAAASLTGDNVHIVPHGELLA